MHQCTHRRNGYQWRTRDRYRKKPSSTVLGIGQAQLSTTSDGIWRCSQLPVGFSRLAVAKIPAERVCTACGAIGTEKAPQVDSRRARATTATFFIFAIGDG